jgi:hypothetical protein
MSAIPGTDGMGSIFQAAPTVHDLNIADSGMVHRQVRVMISMAAVLI